MNRTKILFFLPHLKAGGAERVVSFIFKSLDRTIFDPKLVVIGFKKDNHYSVQGEDVIYLNRLRLRNALFDIIKTIKTEKPDLVFSSIGHINIYLGFLKYFLPKVKFIAREASVFSKMSSFNTKKQIPLSWMKKCYQKLDAIIYQSEDMKNDFEKIFQIDPSKGLLIHNLITTPSSFLATNKDYNHATKSKFVIVGSILKNKGHERVLKLFEKVNLNFVLEIIGDGPLKEELEEKLKTFKIKNKVIFRGLLKDMEAVYASADFLIQGSYVEGFPNVVLEALSFGVPCVVFDAPGGHREMIIDNENGYIIKNEEEAPLIIERTIRNNWNRFNIQKDAFSRFGSEKIISQYETMFLKIKSK
jgi:glycosyltransferase involved in cell wall biosynthesis